MADGGQRLDVADLPVGLLGDGDARRGAEHQVRLDAQLPEPLKGSNAEDGAGGAGQGQDDAAAEVARSCQPSGDDPQWMATVSNIRRP